MTSTMIKNLLNGKKNYIDPQADFTGKVVILTGGTDGVGKALALRLVKSNVQRLIIGCRNEEKGQRVKEELEATLAIGSELASQDTEAAAKVKPVVEMWTLDLGRLQSVRDFVARFQKEGGDHLDYLFNNAGTIQPSRKKTVDGYELHFQANFLSHFLLTTLLLPNLLATPGARVIHTGSDAAYSGKIDLSDLQCEKLFIAAIYPTTKLMNQIFSNELNKRYRSQGLISNCVHPGFVSSSLGSDMPAILRPLRSAIMYFGLTPEHASRNLLYAATSNDEDVLKGGGYFYNGKALNMPAAAETPDIGSKLWTAAEELCANYTLLLLILLVSCDVPYDDDNIHHAPQSKPQPSFHAHSIRDNNKAHEPDLIELVAPLLLYAFKLAGSILAYTLLECLRYLFAALSKSIPYILYSSVYVIWYGMSAGFKSGIYLGPVFSFFGRILVSAASGPYHLIASINQVLFPFYVYILWASCAGILVGWISGYAIEFSAGVIEGSNAARVRKSDTDRLDMPTVMHRLERMDQVPVTLRQRAARHRDSE
ncbi:hypothetical protein BZG36_01619 [Bifiguratus adelaidae]|uniref:Uncharacterized protein n=1 Tax=Bifiguratus adelaidae TaxID=1938954 RepID=A0A261Y488_9FUNG|nr:hypothetical protein BZG36_01619 [Bifiguratus adelaidae]